MKEEFYKDVTVTSKGQLTLPVSIRNLLKLGSKRKVRIGFMKDGTVTMQSLPDVMELYGVLKSEVPYDPHEKRKAREAIAKNTRALD